jgi:hypothetical protein
MLVVASMWRGTRLGLLAVAGAVLAQFIEASTLLASQPLLEPLFRLQWIIRFKTHYGPGLDWVVGALAGAIANDILTILQDETPPLGMRAGIMRGVTASVGGVVALVFAPLLLETAASQWRWASSLIEMYPGDNRMLAFAFGLWAGAVAGDLWQR